MVNRHAPVADGYWCNRSYVNIDPDKVAYRDWLNEAQTNWGLVVISNAYVDLATIQQNNPFFTTLREANTRIFHGATRDPMFVQ